jgi:Fe-S cluster biosynthesis and repair protein YggX
MEMPRVSQSSPSRRRSATRRRWTRTCGGHYIAALRTKRRFIDTRKEPLMADVTCVRCGQTRAGLPYAPFNNDLGKRIQGEICNVCWQEWLKQQTMLINHYGLNVRDAEAKTFLYEQTDKFLFGTGEADQVDTSKQGTIQW